MDQPSEELRLRAYRLQPSAVALVPSEPRRPWMDATPEGFANRCLPLLIANASGWLVLNDATAQITWDGSGRRDGLRVQYEDEQPWAPALSHFGSGIVTWRLPYLFRTPPGWNLVVRGAPNDPVPGVRPLDAVVETDWAVSPFTVNWQVMSAGEVVVQAGQPLCLVHPQRRGELEAFSAELCDIEEDPVLQEQVRAWSQDRASFLHDLPVEGTPAHQQGWQRDYFRGRSAPAHQTRVRVSPFVHVSPDVTDHQETDVGDEPLRRQ